MTARYRLMRSRRAQWSRRLAYFAATLLLLIALLHRLNYVDAIVTFAVIIVAVFIALLALGLALAAFFAIWLHGHKGLGNAIVGFVISLAVLAIPGYSAFQILEKPAIFDVTTDTENPPPLTVAARVRASNANSTVYDPANADIQHQAYPGIGPIEIEMPIEDAYQIVLRQVADERWQVVDEQAPANELDGHIEAVAMSPVFGFRDDISIVVRRVGEETTLVDMRSASRYGRHDMGRNAERIFSFLSSITETVSPTAPVEQN